MSARRRLLALLGVLFSHAQPPEFEARTLSTPSSAGDSGMIRCRVQPGGPWQIQGTGRSGARHGSAAPGDGTAIRAYQVVSIVDLQPSARPLGGLVAATGFGTVYWTAATACQSTFRTPIMSTALSTPTMRAVIRPFRLRMYGGRPHLGSPLVSPCWEPIISHIRCLFYFRDSRGS